MKQLIHLQKKEYLNTINVLSQNKTQIIKAFKEIGKTKK